jgi:hypothetical protein
VDEAGTSYRLYGRNYILAVAQDMGGEGAQGVRVGVDGGHLYRPTLVV